MPSGSDPVPVGFIVLEMLPGLIALWFVQFGGRAKKAKQGDSPLAPWDISFTSFFIGVLCVLMSGMVAGGALQIAVLFFPSISKDESWQMITSLGILHSCFIGGALLARSLMRSAPDWLGERQSQAAAPPAPFKGSTLFAGIVVFFITLTVVHPLNQLSNAILLHLGLPTTIQDQVQFLHTAQSPIALVLFALFAVVLAPISEELIFRGGLFRYLRTRVPRWVALLLPAVIFAGPHVNSQTLHGLNSVLPLIGLAVVFSLAYERTGRIAVPIIAHALFNLHTVVLVLLGVAG
jgi:uncharacterized protein